MGIGDRRVRRRPRPLSAAANCYLAARIAAAAPFLRLSGELDRLRSRAAALLERAADIHGDVASIRAVQERWTAELAPVRIIAAPS